MISLAGVDLCLEDFDGEVSQFLKRYLPLEDLRLFGASPVSFRKSRRFDPPDGRIAFGAEVPNWPEPPALRINSLYWPTGASRWAHGVFLATREQLDQILEATGGSERVSNEPQQLVLADSRIQPGEITEDSFLGNSSGATGLSTEMYLLPPRPISLVDDPEAQTLWLLPLVDVRYFWQFRSTGLIETTFDDTLTWDELIDQVSSRLGVTAIMDEVPEDYAEPDFTQASRQYDNAATLLDYLTWNVGMRVSRWIDGSLNIQTAQTATDRLAANLIPPWAQIAGGAFHDEQKASIVPAAVEVVFQPQTGNHDDLDFFTIQASTFGIEESTPSITKTFHCASIAGEDDNEALANKIAEDFYAWLAKRYDYTFVGIKSWKPTGFDDHVRWTVGLRRADGTFDATTRVQCLPYNVGIEDLIHQCGIDFPSHIRVKLEEVLEAGGTANSSVYLFDGSEWIDTEKDVDVREIMGLCEALSAGSYGTAVDMGEKVGYALVSVECACTST